MSMHGTDGGYERLLQLAELGDKGAARELLREALRRSDWEVYEAALEVLSPGTGLSEATCTDNLLLTDDNLDAFARLEVVVGDLEICLGEREDLGVLVRLTRVTGQVRVRGCERLRELLLPSLAEVQGLEIEENAALERIDLPALASVDADVKVWGHDRLNTVQMDALTRCTLLDMRIAPGLRTLSVQGLETASVYLEYLEAIELLAFPSLVQADQWMVGMCGVTTVEAVALRQVAETLRLEGLFALTALRLPALENVGSLEIRRCGALRQVELPQLERVEEQFEMVALGEAAVLDAPSLKWASWVMLGEGGIPDARLPALAEVDALNVRNTKAVDGQGRLCRGEGEAEAVRILVLPALTKIRKLLCVEHEPTLKELRLPTLKELGDFSHPTALRIHDTALKTVSMPALLRVSGAFWVADNPDLTRVDLPDILFLFGQFAVEHNGAEIRKPTLMGSIDSNAIAARLLPLPVFKVPMRPQTQSPGWGALIFFVAILVGVLLGLWSGIISPGRGALRGFPSAYDLKVPNIKIPHLPPETHALLGVSIGRLMAVSAKMQSVHIPSIPTTHSTPTKSLCDHMASEQFLTSTGDVDARTLLASQDAIPACVRGNLRICNLENDTLQGLEQIHAVEGDVEICNNPHLQNLNGLDGLSVIEGDLTITRNAALSYLGALKVDMLDGGAHITKNPTLKICVAAHFPADTLTRFVASDNAPDGFCTTDALRSPPF